MHNITNSFLNMAFLNAQASVNKLVFAEMVTYRTRHFFHDDYLQVGDISHITFHESPIFARACD